MTKADVSPDIFKAYDIRGIVDKTLTEDAVTEIAKAYATRCTEKNITKIAVGRDGRLSGPRLAAALIKGLNDAGIDVIDVGAVTTPLLYFAALKLAAGSGIMITGSHNPPAYNGFKLMLGRKTLAGEDIQALLQLIQKKSYQSFPNRRGTTVKNDIYPAYRETIVNDVHLARPLNIIIDAGNGIAGKYAGDLYRALGCEVTELYCEVDGNFPHHHPDPAKPENLHELKEALKNSQDAEVGFAFDGDGDRLGVVTCDGNIIWPDRLLMLFAADVLKRNPGAKVIYDVKCTRLLEPWIKKRGGVPLMSQTGHSYIKAAIEKEEAALAGEMSGHLFFKERWFGFDDGLYAGARALEILSQSPDATRVLNALPQALATPEISIAMHKENENHQLIKALQSRASFPGATRVLTIDGLRVEYLDGFGLVRASNTTPTLVLRFEADNEAALTRIQDHFRDLLTRFSPYTF